MKIYNEAAVREDYRRLTKFLIREHLTITTMESATSGQIASLITDTEGSSAVLKGAFVTYCNEAKIMQGVSAEIIEKYSVYSKETAEAMAAACRSAYQADIGIGVTGTMGNVDPANASASVPGQVYFAISRLCKRTGGIADVATEGVTDEVTADATVKITSYHVELPPQESRLQYKLAVAQEIYEVLEKQLQICK